MKESNVLRGVCEEFREAVMDFPWMDDITRITGSVRAWRAAFLAARAVNISGRNDIVDSDFVHIRDDARARLHSVNMVFCGRVTDAAFEHLRGIQSLDMTYCDQVTVTDAAFVIWRDPEAQNGRLQSGDHH